MARPVIALLTDFGNKDHYVGSVKGVILGICPDASCVDITHEVPPHDVLGGALELAASYKFFPPGTIFLVVVDPGVGSTRRPIAAEAGTYLFVAPDNGVLALVFNDIAPRRVVELTEQRYARPTISRTFEGRDRFGPAAAWLATGIDLGALGKPITSWQRIEVPVPAVTDHEIVAEVLQVDRFGNLVTNLDRATFDRFAEASPLEIVAGTQAVGKVVGTYADAEPGAVCALFGSSERLEIAVNGGSAAGRLALGRGARIRISRS